MLAHGLQPPPFVDLVAELVVGRAQFGGPQVDLSLQLDASLLGLDRAGGRPLPTAEQDAAEGGQQGDGQGAEPAGDGDRPRHAGARRRQQGQPPTGVGNGGRGHGVEAVGDVRGDADQVRAIRVEGEGGRNRRPGGLGLSQPTLQIDREGAVGVEPPGGHGGDDHNAVRVGDIGRLARGAPVGLQGVEFDLGHDDPERPAGGVVDAARQIQAGPAADGAEGEESRLAVAHGFIIVGPELIVGADETGRQPPVAGRQRAPVGVEGVDGGGADVPGEALEFPVQPRRPGRVGAGQEDGQIRILGEDHGQGPVPLQLAAQDGGVQGARGRRLTPRGGAGVATGDLASGQDDEDGDQAPGRAEEPPLSRG